MDRMEALRRALDDGHEALVWKLEGASQYDVRRPLTPTGTSLLGLHRRVRVHAGATLDALDLDAPGRVPTGPSPAAG